MPLSVPIGFDFRASLGGATDVAPDVFVGLSTIYSASPGYGWVTNAPNGSLDQATTPDTPRLDGMNYIAAATDPAVSGTFRADIPAGSYQIRLAIGDRDNPHTNYNVSFWDGAGGLLLAVTGTSQPANEYIDATNVVRTSPSDWTTNNVLSATITTTGSFLRMTIGTGPSGPGDFTTLRYMGIVAAAPSTPTQTYSPFGTPSPARSTPLGAVQTYFAPISTDPETTTVDRWHQALSTPRGRGYPASEQAASFWGNFTPVGPETITVDKWFKPLSEPYLKRSYPASEQTATPPWFSTAKETTTLDRWFEPFSVPYGLKYPASQQPAVSLWSTFTPAPAVVPALDSWLQSLGLPQPLRFPVEKTFWSWGIPAIPAPTPPPVVQPPPQGGAADDDEDEADRRRRKWLEWNRQRLRQKQAEQAKQAKAKPPVEAPVAEIEVPAAEEAPAPAPPPPADKTAMADMLLMANLQATQMANAQKNEANAAATKAAAELVAKALAADREDDDEAAMMLGGW